MTINTRGRLNYLLLILIGTEELRFLNYVLDKYITILIIWTFTCAYMYK